MIRLFLSILCLLTIITTEVVLDLIPLSEIEMSMNDPIEGESEVELEEESKVKTSQLAYALEDDLELAHHNFLSKVDYDIPTNYKEPGPPPDRFSGA